MDTGIGYLGGGCMMADFSTPKLGHVIHLLGVILQEIINGMTR